MRTKLFPLLVLFSLGILFTGFSPVKEAPAKDKFVVVLDAGHGGHDSGNRGNGYYEKNIALNIVLKIGAELEKLPDVEVIYTRKTDVFVTLAGRAEIANRADADLFVSVHCNAHSSQASGTETFVLGIRRSADNMEVAKRENSVIYLEEDYKVTYNGFDPNSPESHIGLTLMQEEYLDQSIFLADLVQKNFTNSLKRKNRGVKQDVFLVLRETYMPSVLIETGFLTNNSEGAYLNSRSGQEHMSDAIVKAVVAYKNSINLNVLEDLEQTPAVDIQVTAMEQQTEDLYDDVVFRVQLAATSKKVDPSPRNFKGLRDISRSKEGKLFKYYYGSTSSYLQIQDLHEEARKKGYPSSFVVAFKNGEKISVNEALKRKVN